jgi:phospholipid transport system transporter-binding protein
MSSTAAIVEEKNRLIVSGELNFETVAVLWKQSLPLLVKYPHINIDLSQITSSNSAGLALLLEWLKYGKRENKVITFSGIPQQLQSLAAIAGVDLIIS